MVQSYQSPVRVYKYPFELVMAAYIRRFPTCDLIPIMAGTEILSEFKSEDEAVEEISRRCKLHVEAPYLLKKIMGVEFIYFIQTNNLDRRQRTLQIKAHNESFITRVVIHENCKYWVHPENNDWTCFEQSASLDVKSFFGFESTVEKLSMKQYSQNISKGKEIIQLFIDILREDGITEMPVWQCPKKASIKKKKKKKEPKEDAGEDTEDESSSNMSSEGSQSENLTLGSSAANQKLKSDEETLAKLDSDYIERCLGDLTLLQESRLVQLRKWVARLQKGKVPSDTTLLRFLRARDFNLEKSREMLSQSLIWRKKNQVDKILSEYQVPQVIKDYFPGGWHFYDKDDRPLYLLRLGQMDVKGLIKSIGEEGLLKHTLHICEEGLRLTAEATSTLGKPITTWTLLVDLEGLNMRHLWRPGIKTLLKVIEIVENNYPETMSHVLIIRAPRVFPILWTLVSSFIDENTRSKFLFYGGNDYQNEGGLVDYMAKEHIPECLCKRGSLSYPGLVPESLFNFSLAVELESNHGSGVVGGGLVPKNLYLPGEEVEIGGKQHLALSDQSIYHSVPLARGQVHEVVLLIEDVGSVICWDFDVMKSDVGFSVLRTKIPITNRQEPQTPTGAMGMIDAVMGLDEMHRTVIEKSWKEGQEYFHVEPALVCHDGESVQGSHVTVNMGTYVLQWRYYESTQHNSPRDIIDSFTAHKAKVMYYYETLKSSDYRGSMSSLQSCQSGFSSLSSNKGESVNSSCPSR